MRQGQGEIGRDRKGSLAADDIDQLGRRQVLHHRVEALEIELAVQPAKRSTRSTDHAGEEMAVLAGIRCVGIGRVSGAPLGPGFLDVFLEEALEIRKA